MLLEGRCSLRFTKLEKRSPAMAKVATRVPTSHPSPISTAQMDVANTDTTMPRMVFEGPNMGWPSTKRAPPSSGRANAAPRSFLAPTAVPLATTSRISSCSNKEPCITAPHSDHLNPRIIGCDLSRGHGGCLLGNVCYWHLADALPIASRGLVPAEKRTCLKAWGKSAHDPKRTLPVALSSASEDRCGTAPLHVVRQGSLHAQRGCA